MGTVGASRVAECWWQGAQGPVWPVSGQLASCGGILVHAAGVLWKCRAPDNSLGGWGQEGVRTGDLNSLPSLGVWVLSSVQQNKGHRWGLDEAPGRSRASCHCPPFALLSWTGQPSGTWLALSPVSLPPTLPAFVPTTGHQHCPVSPQAERGLSCRGFHWSSQSPSGRGSSRLGPSRL